MEDKESSSAVLRRPVVGGILAPQNNSLLAIYNLEEDLCVGSPVPGNLYTNLKKARLLTNDRLANLDYCSQTDVDFLREQFLTTFYRALSFSENHDEVILYGKLAESLSKSPAECMGDDQGRHSLWATGLSNYINAISYQPRIFAFLLKYLCEGDNPNVDHGILGLVKLLGLKKTAIARINRFLESISYNEIEIDRCCNAILQLNEFLSFQSYYNENERALVAFG